jgi:hypothetical protein
MGNVNSDGLEFDEALILQLKEPVPVSALQTSLELLRNH